MKNLSTFLANSTKILNITKRSLPLLKELNPLISKVNTLKFKKKEETTVSSDKSNNNSITFFK